MRNLRVFGVLGLSLALALAGCGQADTTQATLIVQSVPQAEVFVDGVSQGESGAELSLSAGVHKIELRLEMFESFETSVTLAVGATKRIEASLRAQDPADPLVIAKLGEAEGIEIAPFAAPQVTRGGRSKSAVATLLWPSRDVRKAGLVNYAIEADETYGSDATLEFRRGRKVLYREAFKPETLTTVRRLPATVLENVKVGTKIKWGLYFEDRRRPITAEFHVVNRPKAERQLERLRKSRHMARQPKITQQIMGATVLENNRLFTEALVANIDILTNYPQSMQPCRGIVTTLRRLDAKDSELFAFASPFVGGKGGRAVVRQAQGGLGDVRGPGIAAWAAPVPTPIADAGTGAATPVTPGGEGVTPPSTPEATPDSATPDSAAPGSAAPGSAAPGTATQPSDTALLVERMRNELAQVEEESRVAQEALGHAQSQASEARAAAETAEAQAVTAEAAAVTARSAVEQADEPTRDEQESMHRSAMEAEQAREAANAAHQTAESAREQAMALEAAASELTQSIQDHKQSLQAAMAKGPAGTDSQATDPRAVEERPAPAAQPTEADLQVAVEKAATVVGERNTAWDEAKEGLAQAEREHAENPTDTSRQNVENASERLESAASTAAEALKALESARQAIEQYGAAGVPGDRPSTEK